MKYFFAKLKNSRLKFFVRAHSELWSRIGVRTKFFFSFDEVVVVAGVVF